MFLRISWILLKKSLLLPTQKLHLHFKDLETKLISKPVKNVFKFEQQFHRITLN